MGKETNSAEWSVDLADLLEVIRCPACVPDDDTKGQLDLVKECWLVCKDCGRKYPISQDIPILLVDEGNKWIDIAITDLPVPPPTPE